MSDLTTTEPNTDEESETMKIPFLTLQVTPENRTPEDENLPFGYYFTFATEEEQDGEEAALIGPYETEEEAHEGARKYLHFVLENMKSDIFTALTTSQDPVEEAKD